MTARQSRRPRDMTRVSISTVVVLAFLGCSVTHAAELKDLNVSPLSVVGGQPVTVTVLLTETAVASPLVRSSFPDIIEIPPQTMAVVNRTFATQSFNTAPVDAPQDVAVIATLNNRSVTRVVRVLPPPLSTAARHEIGPDQMSALIKLAEANGFGFLTSKILKDTVRCGIAGSSRYGIGLDIVRPYAPSIAETVGACQFTLFANRDLADGFTFQRDGFEIRRSPGAIGVTWRFVESPPTGSNMRMVITAENRDPYIRAAVEIRRIVIIGPPRSQWQDAFR